MNHEYSKLEARRFSDDFAAEFTSFINSNKNTAFFDKTWSSKEHRQRFSKLLANYPLHFYEFEASTLSLRGLKEKIVDSKELRAKNQTDFSMLSSTMENSKDIGLVMVYRCTELSSNSVQLLSDLNAFLTRSNSKWKIAYFGEIEGVYPIHLELLAPDYIYTKLAFAKRPSLKPLNLSMTILLCVLTIFCILTATHYSPIIQKKYRALNRALNTNIGFDEALNAEDFSLPTVSTDLSHKWLEQDIDDWTSRVSEFDKAMSVFNGDTAPQVPGLNRPTRGKNARSLSPRRMSNQLILAAKNGDLEVVTSMISSGVSIDAVSPHRETLLILASMHGQDKLVTWLLENGANVGLSDSDNGSALYYASVNGHIEVAKKLLENDASTTQVSRLNKTPLMASVHNNYLELSALLLAANSDVNQQDHSGWSALYFAIWNGNSEMTQLLLKNGADANLKDRDGYTPIDIAKAKKDIEILKML